MRCWAAVSPGFEGQSRLATVASHMPAHVAAGRTGGVRLGPVRPPRLPRVASPDSAAAAATAKPRRDNRPIRRTP